MAISPGSLGEPLKGRGSAGTPALVSGPISTERLNTKPLVGAKTVQNVPVNTGAKMTRGIVPLSASEPLVGYRKAISNIVPAAGGADIANNFIRNYLPSEPTTYMTGSAPSLVQGESPYAAIIYNQLANQHQAESKHEGTNTGFQNNEPISGSSSFRSSRPSSPRGSIIMTGLNNLS